MSSAAPSRPTIGHTNKARVLYGHADALTAHTGIPGVMVLDGDRALTAADDGRVWVWDYTTGECKHSFPVGGKPTIQAIALLPGTRLIAVGGEGGAYVYCSDTGAAKAVLVTSGQVKSMGVHGDVLLVGTVEGVVHCYNLPIDFTAAPEPSYKTRTTHGCGGGCECTAKYAPRLPGQHCIPFKRGSATTAIASLLDDHFAVADASGSIYIVNDKTYKLRNTIKAHSDNITALVVLPATAAEAPAPAAAAAAGGRAAGKGGGAAAKGGAGTASGSATAGGVRLASSSTLGEVFLWNPATGKRLAKLLCAGTMCYSMSIMPGSGRLVAATIDGLLNFWNADKPDRVTRLNVAIPDSMGPMCVLGLPNGRVMSAAGDLALHVHDVRTAARKLIMCGHGKWDVAAIAASPDGSRITTADTKGVLIVWDTDTRRSLHKITSPRDGKVSDAENLTVMTNGTIISGRPDGLRMWSPVTGKLVGRKMARGPLVVALPGNAFAAPGAHGLDAFHPSPTATSDDPDSAYVTKWSLKGPAFAAGSVGALTMLSKKELAVSILGEVLVLDAETGEALRSFDARGRKATSLAVDATGTYLTAASDSNNIVCVYNISDRSVHHAFQDFGAGPTTLAALPDGRIAACQGAPYASAYKSCLPFMNFDAPDMSGIPVEQATLLALRMRERAATVKILNPVTKRCDGIIMTHARGSTIPIAALPDGRIVTNRMSTTRDPEVCVWSPAWTRRRHALAAAALRRAAAVTGGAAATAGADAASVVGTAAAPVAAAAPAAAVAGAGTAAAK